MAIALIYVKRLLSYNGQKEGRETEVLRPNSLLIRFLNRVCDLLFLNIALVLSCCTVIFSGTGVTSLYSITLKMMRGGDCDPIKGFLRGLREKRPVRV